MWLLLVAAFGMIVPNGLFACWLFSGDWSLATLLADRLALALIGDVFGSTFLLTWLFAKKPIGPWRWPWFLGLCLLGTLCFGIPAYLWLNWHSVAEPRPDVATWWRSV